MASDLRDEIARVLYAEDAEIDTRTYPPGRLPWEEASERAHRQAHYEADAVLRVVGERLLSDEAVEAVAMTYEPDSFVGDAPHADEALRDARDVLSAAWRVVTGSNHE